MTFAPGTNGGHGHVWARPDGYKARCGGPGLCIPCSLDLTDKIKSMPHPNGSNMAPNKPSMQIWIDTEFIEDGKTIELLSIGMVREDGQALYMENNEADLSKAGEWVQSNVIVHLDWQHNGFPRSEIAETVRAFAGDGPVFWGYYADYDWVVLCQLFGTMMDLPKGWPMYCRDVKQLCDDLGNPKLPTQRGTKHNAYEDALWTREAWRYLNLLSVNKRGEASPRSILPIHNRVSGDAPAWYTADGAAGWAAGYNTAVSDVEPHFQKNKFELAKAETAMAVLQHTGYRYDGRTWSKANPE